MNTYLIITKVDKLLDEIVSTLDGFEDVPGVYISLNKTQKSIEADLISRNINTSKLFFIDCVTGDRDRDDVLHIFPDNLDMLLEAVEAFIDDIKSEKFIIIDAISTLLIYNSEIKVAKAIQRLTEMAVSKKVKLFAFSPVTKGEELLVKIYNFFEKVKK